MLELIFEFIGEMLLQVVLQICAELGWHALSEPFKRDPHPGVAAIGCILFGMLAGGISLFVFHASLVHGTWRLVNLAVAPFAAGFATCALGWWRAGRGQELVRLDRFGYGYSFALALALVRYAFAA